MTKMTPIRRRIGIKKNLKAFTLVELIITIAILAILAAAAVPLFGTLHKQAKDAAVKGAVGTVRAALSIYRMNEVAAKRPAVWPPSLSVRDIADGGLASAHIMANGDLPKNPWARDAGKTDPDSMAGYFTCGLQGQILPDPEAWVYDECDGRFWANTAANGGVNDQNDPNPTENWF